MSNITQARQALLGRVLDGDGFTSQVQRRGAFDNAGLTEPLSTLVDKVARHANQVTDPDFTAAIESGLSEDQIFEFVVCAAIGQAARDYDAALSALDAAAGRE